MTRQQRTTEKERLEKILNEIFGVEISWRRLPYEDLKLLAYILTNDKTKLELCRRLKCPKIDFRRVLEDIIPSDYQGPIIKALRETVE